MRILEFLMQTVHVSATAQLTLQEMQGREYAVECIRSLTATEESDAFLVKCRGMLDCLAGIAGMDCVEVVSPFKFECRLLLLCVSF